MKKLCLVVMFMSGAITTQAACPDINIVKNTAVLTNAVKLEGNYYVEAIPNRYQTSSTWNFALRKIDAQTPEEAIAMAKEILLTMSFYTTVVSPGGYTYCFYNSDPYRGDLNLYHPPGQ